ncbi:alpha/beta hydrolase [Pochonia chlamydosporia 170]|uniref:Alpha/beta hydrolase n=1 Tax=Pochonia chlamydosporia 170 TaxID=1380566 RepID=A0A179G674_METCM|nr:alpha/beta hydrolase [Pochonia chlamydosporia 170]OAQ72883.1 alpha/beta hydrolase [Pochonia chlamydosporia 170]
MNSYCNTQDELKVEKAIFVGISMGASVVLQAALSHPSRVAALVVIAATGKSATPEQKAAFDQLAQIWSSTPTPSEEIMDAAIRSWGGDPDVTGPRARHIKDYWVERHSGADNINAVLESNQEREDIIARLESIRCPVLMIHGENDETYTLGGAEEIRNGLRNVNVQFEVIKGSGHLVIGMRDSHDVSMLIKDFVNEVALTG